MEEVASQYDVDQEMLTSFLDESEESLATLDGLFVELEQRPKDHTIIESIFRVAHSIKGLAAYLSLKFVRDLTHELETVLDSIRKDRLVVDSGIVDGLLAGFDELSHMLTRVRARQNQVDDENQFRGLLDKIGALSASNIAAPQEGEYPVDGGNKTPSETVELDSEQDHVIEKIARAPRERDSIAGQTPTGRTMRVSEDKVDVFMQYVGDLIEISESFNFFQKRIDSSVNDRLAQEFRDINSGFGQLSDKLQKSLLEIRKIPARNLVQKVPRMVRDLAQKLGKKAQVVMTGQDVQIDKSMIEALESPINHLVRNCVDHGLERPEQRRPAGKNETGTIAIDVSRTGDDVIVQIRDDGSGIDPEAIRRKAVQKGLTTPEQAKALSDREVLQFVLCSGFSTAKRVTDVSGRGVGMDVVRSNVTSLRGTIDLESEYGRGTTVSLRLPSSLTVLVVNSLLAAVGDQQYFFKLEDIYEVVRPRPEDIMTVNGTAEYLRLHEGVYPLIRLHELFGIETECTDPASGAVILVYVKDKCAGILVDRILGQQRTVVKNLKGEFLHLKMIAGAAILADRRVGLVLNIPGIVGGCLGR